MTDEILSHYHQFADLEEQIIQWGNKRGIIQAGNRERQTLKACEEMGELAGAVAKGENIADHVGDVVVTLILLCEMSGTSVADCLAVAYQEIKDRKGELRDGCFVKHG